MVRPVDDITKEIITIRKHRGDQSQIRQVRSSIGRVVGNDGIPWFHIDLFHQAPDTNAKASKVYRDMRRIGYQVTIRTNKST